MRKITGKENYKTPVIALFVFSMMFIPEATDALKNMENQGSILLSQPILFTGNLFETLSRVCWFLIPAALFWEAIKERNPLLKLTYFMGVIPLVLTNPIIDKIGFKFLYLARALVLFAVVMCLMKYLINVTNLYKKATEKNTKPDNPVAPVDGEKS